MAFTYTMNVLRAILPLANTSFPYPQGMAPAHNTLSRTWRNVQTTLCQPQISTLVRCSHAAKTSSTHTNSRAWWSANEFIASNSKGPHSNAISPAVGAAFLRKSREAESKHHNGQIRSLAMQASTTEQTLHAGTEYFQVSFFLDYRIFRPHQPRDVRFWLIIS